MRRLAFLLVLTSLFVTGCDSGTDAGDGIEGRYSLRTINGATVPASVVQGGITFTFQSGHFQINSDNTFSAALTVTAAQGGQSATETFQSLGTWTQNNNAVRFDYADGSSPDVGTISGTELSMTSDGIALTFRR